jgi:hypothetical protein
MSTVEELTAAIEKLKAEITERYKAAEAKQNVAYHGEGADDTTKITFMTWWINEERPALKKMKVDYERLRIEKCKLEHRDTDILELFEAIAIFKWKEAQIQSKMDHEEKRHDEHALIKDRRAIRRLRNQVLLRQAMIHHAHLVREGKVPPESVEEFTHHENHVSSLKAQLHQLEKKHERLMKEHEENKQQSEQFQGDHDAYASWAAVDLEKAQEVEAQIERIKGLIPEEEAKEPCDEVKKLIEELKHPMDPVPADDETPEALVERCNDIWSFVDKGE